MTALEIKLKVMEAVQDDVNKGIVKTDSTFMKQIGVNPGDIVEVKGERITAAVVDRAYPGDIGLNIIRMDGNTRRNAKTSIGELVTVKKAEVKPAKMVTIAPAIKGVMIKAPPGVFKQGLLGKAVVKGDIVSLGGNRRRVEFRGDNINDIFSMMESRFAGFGFGDIKLVVVDTLPKKEIVVIDNETEVEFNPQAVEMKEEEALSLGINYEDIGGLGDEIKKVREMVELPLKHPEIFQKLGIEAPKGVLLHGPPGTGKTLLAKAVASETNSHFILINGPEVISKFYGESEANLRKKFEEAEKNAPSIIFFDEIDAIATKREETKGDVEKRVVAQLLGLMDGLKSRGKVIVLAATNIPNQLDLALRRPGRFDREIEIGVPDKTGRHEILKIHTRNMPIKGTLYPDIISKIILSEMNSKINILNKELQDKLEKLKELEEKKKQADENILSRIIETIKRTNKEVESFKNEIGKLESLLKELKGQKTCLSKLAEDFKIYNENNFSSQPDDPRRNIIENKRSEDYQKLEEFNLTNLILSKSEQEGRERDLGDVAKITHGFVGADLSALAKEAAMIVLRRILPELKLEGVEEGDPIPNEILEKLVINQKDFIDALKIVRPSAMREVLVETPDIGWKDIGGLEDIKEKLKEAVEWPLKQPEVFKRMGIRPPRGILLYGPPGTGKTLLAKAVAKESEANFILVNGPSLLSKWVGESEKALREIFRKARQTSPTILFFDEIDALVPRRGGSSNEGRVSEKMVNQMLTELDGLESLNDVVVIGATNRPDIVDPALLRPGRFDRVILTTVPDQDSRRCIFEIYLKKMPVKYSDIDNDSNLEEYEEESEKRKNKTLKKMTSGQMVSQKEVDDLDKNKKSSKRTKDNDSAESRFISWLTSRTESYVGADIEGICREAAMSALREDLKAKIVTKKHFDQALEVVAPSVDKETEEIYGKLKDYFSSARAKQIKEDRADYFG